MGKVLGVEGYMVKKRLKQICGDIQRALSARGDGPRFSRSRRELGLLLADGDFSRRLSALLGAEPPLDCASLLEACRPVLDRLGREPQEGWLGYCYDWARSLMFPGLPAQARITARTQGGGSGAGADYQDGALFYLTVLQLVFQDEARRLSPQSPLNHSLHFSRLTAEEMAELERSDGYRQFCQAIEQDFVYPMLRLGMELTPYRTLEHIAGVHHVALQLGRSLRACGLKELDLSLVSAAAYAHDLGKFGCRAGERAPYLHYFYTDQWCRRHGLPKLGHIAANHSVWDLEPENLPLEALLLIYADFRVKQESGENGTETTRLYSLEESFEVILSKLDNVDGAKRRRYSFVYAKLRDFEDYLRSLGADTELSGGVAAAEPLPDVVFMSDQQVSRALKFMAVRHNLDLMHRINDPRQFAAILETARGETDWKRLRAYLSIFENYSLYMREEQKVQVLNFLYELLMHHEGDIRRQAAALIGHILARFHSGYAKLRPEDQPPDPTALSSMEQWRRLFGQILIPDHKLMANHKRWICYSLKTVLNSLLEQCTPQDRPGFLQVVWAAYRNPAQADDFTAFTLLDTALYLPWDEEPRLLADFACALMERPLLTVRAAALRLLRRLAGAFTADEAILEQISAMTGYIQAADHVSLRFLQGRLLMALGEDDTLLREDILREGVISEIFLDNLKSATPWVIKEVNIRLLMDFALVCNDNLLHIAAHLSNLIKVSEQVGVRHDAGAALLELAPLLSAYQRNEIAVELLRGLETGQYDFAKYIPFYLGNLCLYLPPAQLDECLDSLTRTMGGADDYVVSLAMSTVGVIYEHYGVYRARFPEEDGPYRRRREQMLGLLLKGLANFRPGVRQEAQLVVGKQIFGSDFIDGHEKRRAFVMIHRKLLFLLREDRGGQLNFYYRAAVLSHLYRFITQQALSGREMDFDPPRPIAFFPGAFDPFTLSHKGIVQEIRDLGCEVLLTIDEFSWSKKTQPHLIRRQLAVMSVADEFHVQVFPDNFPVNLSSPEDLSRLRAAFPGRQLYIVVGGDVVQGASSYRQDPRPGSIHSFDHIIFRRNTAAGGQAKPDYSMISGQVVELSLPAHLEDISSTMIRDGIDLNRDISSLMDPAAQEYIYHHHLYLREPQDKPLFHPGSLHFDYRQGLDGAEEALLAGPLAGQGDKSVLLRSLRQRQDSLILLRDGREQDRVAGFISYRFLNSCQLLSSLGTPQLSAYVRGRSGGRAVLISSLYAAPGALPETAQLLLSEALTAALREEYCYAVYAPAEGSLHPFVREVLELQGFAPAAVEGGMLMAVDMHDPVVLTQNIETAIKDPLCDDPGVRLAISQAHRDLQRTLTACFPGRLVLSMSASVLHHRLVEKITARNGAPLEPQQPRQLGPNVCVPFGKILRGVAVPNTVTKTIHTDKVFDSDLRSFSIEAFPGYSSLENQVRTVASFRRPVLLVDDMLHDGKRISRLAPLLRQEGIRVDQVIVGYITGLGRDVMSNLGLPVDSVYYLPNQRARYVESTLYPFVGGDSIRRQNPLGGGLYPAVNAILPYAAPDLGQGDLPQPGAAAALSRCCLANAHSILLALESAYSSRFSRNLTLGRLGEAIILPLCPDRGACVDYDTRLAASYYLENDMEMLLRTGQA